jgi:nucleoside-diphosphate-sugar epimerase
MKILVLGATGGTGRLIVSDAVAKGHSVLAMVRSAAGADLPGAKLIEGDARDESTLGRALDGCKAVVSALGTGMGFRKISLLTDATRALIPAMTRSGVRRLVCISALGVGDSRGHGGFVFDRLFQPLLLNQARSALVHSIGLSSGPPCSPMTQLKAASGPSSTSQASTAARLLAPMSLSSLSTN